MTFASDYEFMDKMVKMFRLDDNAITKKTVQRTAGISANNSNLEQDQYCANMISKIIQRTAAITNNSKVDEVGLLQTFLSRYK